MGLLEVGQQLWRGIAKRITAEPLASWTHDDVKFACSACGLVETPTTDDCIARYGLDSDLRDIVEKRKAACGKDASEITVEDFKIPRHYR